MSKKCCQASQQQLKQLGTVLAGLEGIGLAAVLAGNLFEHFGHAVLPGGVQLKARRLGPSEAFPRQNNPRFSED